MLKHEIALPPEHLYPPEEWRVTEARYSDEFVDRTETVFSLGNGYVGIRGSCEEGRPALCPGTFVNGFHESWPIVHAEGAHALARKGQTIVNVPDATIIKLYVDDEPFFLPTARLDEYVRVLDMRAGTLTRELVWVTGVGKQVRVRSCRLVSLEYRHLVAMTYEVTIIDHAAPVVISSLVLNRQDSRQQDGLPEYRPVDPRLATVLPDPVLNVRAAELAGQRILLGYQTTSSKMTLGVGVDHVIDGACSFQAAGSLGDDASEVVVTADALPGVPIRITKYATYQTSRSIPVPELVDRCRRTLDRAVRDGFDHIAASQLENLERFWDRADVRVQARFHPVRQQQAIRWNLYQVAQATWRAEGAGVPAKGLTGQAYEGHYFWDTEIYVLPFLTYTQPSIARNLLRFRHSMLDSARERAAEMSQRGALFPWRTINGEEASSNFQQGTAQYHINADIAYAVKRYAQVEGSGHVLDEIGAQILVETARLWEDLGFYGADNRFHIHGVTGPDEYTTVVNDNTYTNLMARLNLNFAAATIRRLREERPEDYAALVHQVRLKPVEVESWERAAAAMHVPFDEERRIHPQDETFLDREPWDLDATPREKFPLLLHYHPLVIYRHQVLNRLTSCWPCSCSATSSPRSRSAATSTTTTGSPPVTRPCPHRAEHHRRRDRPRAQGPRILPVRGAHGPGERRGQRLGRRPHRLGRRRMVIAGLRVRRRARFRRPAVLLAQAAACLERARLLAALPRSATPRQAHPRRGALPRRGRRAAEHCHQGRVTPAQPG